MLFSPFILTELSLSLSVRVAVVRSLITDCIVFSSVNGFFLLSLTSATADLVLIGEIPVDSFIVEEDLRGVEEDVRGETMTGDFLVEERLVRATLTSDFPVGDVLFDFLRVTETLPLDFTITFALPLLLVTDSILPV